MLPIPHVDDNITANLPKTHPTDNKNAKKTNPEKNRKQPTYNIEKKKKTIRQVQKSVKQVQNNAEFFFLAQTKKINRTTITTDNTTVEPRRDPISFAQSTVMCKIADTTIKRSGKKKKKSQYLAGNRHYTTWGKRWG